jgi:hypothetical protein
MKSLRAFLLLCACAAALSTLAACSGMEPPTAGNPTDRRDPRPQPPSPVSVPEDPPKS